MAGRGSVAHSSLLVIQRPIPSTALLAHAAQVHQASQLLRAHCRQHATTSGGHQATKAPRHQTTKPPSHALSSHSACHRCATDARIG